MIPEYITRELREGTSLEDCLVKYHTNLQELFSPKPKPKKIVKPKKKVKTNNPSQYIQQINGKFYLRKQVRGKLRLFGTYSCLEDAQKVREELKRIGWNKGKFRVYVMNMGLT